MTTTDKVTAVDLYEVDRNGDVQPTEAGHQLFEAIDDRLDRRVGDLARRIDAYIAEEVHPVVESEIEDAVGELRKLMLLAVSELGGPDARRAFIDKVGALAKRGALSAATGEWASGAPDKAAANRQSITPGARPAAEGFDPEEAEMALEVFDDVTSRLDKKQVHQMKELCEDIEFDGDVEDLRNRLKFIAENVFPGTTPTGAYVEAISRTVRH